VLEGRWQAFTNSDSDINLLLQMCCHPAHAFGADPATFNKLSLSHWFPRQKHARDDNASGIQAQTL